MATVSDCACSLCLAERKVETARQELEQVLRYVGCIEEIVVDTGGIGSIVAEELRRAGFNVRAKVKRRAP